MKTPLPAFLLPLVLAACSILQPVKDTAVHHLLDATIPARTISGARPAVAIARPALPSYLDRQQLVTRNAVGGLQMNAYHLWGEPLDAAISRVTATNLSRLANSLNIQPIETFITLDYQSLLEIRISRFEPDANGRVVLECTWKVQPVAGRLGPTRSFTTTVPLRQRDPRESPVAQTGQITAMNEALARLARDIAREL